MLCHHKPLTRGIIITLLLAVALAGSWYLGRRMGGDAPPAAQPQGDADSKKGSIYPDIAGQIVQIMPQTPAIRIAHGEIKGLMRAMTMDMPVADARELVGLRVDQRIIFDLVKMDGRYVMVRLRPADNAKDGVSTEGATTQPIANPLERGDIIPNLTLFDTQGGRLRLDDARWNTKIITFFYVRCPLQQFCPAQSQRLSQLQEQLQANDKRVHLISLTLDSEHDDAKILATYAGHFKADPARWTLAYSNDADSIRNLAARVGARIARHDGTFQIDHALVAIRIDGDRIVDYAYGADAASQLLRGIKPTP